MPERSTENSRPICWPLTESSTPFEFLSSATFGPPATATPAVPAVNVPSMSDGFLMLRTVPMSCAFEKPIVAPSYTPPIDSG